MGIFTDFLGVFSGGGGNAVGENGNEINSPYTKSGNLNRKIPEQRKGSPPPPLPRKVFYGGNPNLPTFRNPPPPPE